MALMYDRMFREQWKMPTASDLEKQVGMERETRGNILDAMRQSEVIVIDNVAKFYLSQKDKKWDYEKDFPNIAPPFPECWLEFSAPSDFEVDRIGFLVSSSVVSDEPNDDDNHVKWVVEILPFFEYEGGIAGPFCQFDFVCNSQGEIRKLPDTGGWHRQHFFGIAYSKMASEELDNLSSRIGSIANPVLLAFCFLHCKNVDLITNDPPAKLSHAHQKRHKRPLVKFKTLDIQPIREILKREGKSEETGLKKALHICRGHFKDFSKGKGLFGKYKGMYWWESQVRGSAIEGTVIKNYNVKRP